MKKYIFCKAWELVKEKGMNISEALKQSWKIAKNSNQIVDRVVEAVAKDSRYTLKDLAPAEFENFDFGTFNNTVSVRNYFVNIFKKSLSDLATLEKVVRIVKANKTAKQFISLQY